MIGVESGSRSVTQLTGNGSGRLDRIGGFAAGLIGTDRCVLDRIKHGGGVGATCTIAVSRGDSCATVMRMGLTAEPGLSPRRHGSYPEGGGNLRGLAPNWASGVLEMKKVFTTGQVAKICKVAPRTVSKWFDSGRLRGYRIPGSQDRRIPREHLLRFLKEHGMPLGDLEAEVYHKVLVVGADAPLQSILRDHLRETDDFRIETAASGFEAGIRAESFHPDCIIIDMALGRIEAGQIAQNLRKSPDHLGTILLALTSDEPGEETFALGFNDAFKKPFDGALLAERVRRLISQKKADEP